MRKTFVDIDSILKEIEQCGGAVLLFSGGLDSSHFLGFVSEKLPEVKLVALRVNLGQSNSVDAIDVENWQERNCEIVTVDATGEFISEYVSKAILANGFYLSEHPLSSSLSRPIMAKKAVELAKERSISLIVHTATICQNSSSRLTNAIHAIAPHIVVGMPNYVPTVSRDDKISEISKVEVEKHPNRLSSDENLWAWEIEGDEITSENRWSSLHVLTQVNQTQDVPPISFCIKFEFGLPVAIDGEIMSLTEIVERLGKVGRMFQIGIYAGLESLPIGKKRLELRYAPAAEIIISAHRSAESATLDESTLRLKRQLDIEWGVAASNGKWFGDGLQALSAFMSRVNSSVNARVLIELHYRRVLVVSVAADPSCRRYLISGEDEKLPTSFVGLVSQ